MVRIFRPNCSLQNFIQIETANEMRRHLYIKNTKQNYYSKPGNSPVKLYLLIEIIQSLTTRKVTISLEVSFSVGEKLLKKNYLRISFYDFSWTFLVWSCTLLA